jgi:hypothetical protein
MSDGPHRSLPMRRHWKNLAERAAKAAYSADEGCEALPMALERDLREAPLAAIRDILSGDQGSFFANDEIERLEAVRQASTRSAACNVVIDCAIQAVSGGLTGDAAFRATLEDACEAQVRSQFRSVEEHYYREASAGSAGYVRSMPHASNATLKPSLQVSCQAQNRGAARRTCPVIPALMKGRPYERRTIFHADACERHRRRRTGSSRAEGPHCL